MSSQHTLTFAQEPEREHSHLREKDSGQSPSLKLTPGAADCSASDSRTSPITETCDTCQEFSQMSSVLVGRVSRFPLVDSEKERQTIAGSGRQCVTLLTEVGPIGSLARTLLESPIYFSTSAKMTWTASAISHKRLIFRLALLDYQQWNGTFGLLPRPSLSNHKGAPKNRFRTSKSYRGNFHEAIREHQADGIYPRPEFVESVKGFPTGWTELKHSGTPTPPRLLKSSPAQSKTT